jgi:hypothetical protein
MSHLAASMLHPSGYEDGAIRVGLKVSLASFVIEGCDIDVRVSGKNESAELQRLDIGIEIVEAGVKRDISSSQKVVASTRLVGREEAKQFDLLSRDTRTIQQQYSALFQYRFSEPARLTEAIEQVVVKINGKVLGNGEPSHFTKEIRLVKNRHRSIDPVHSHLRAVGRTKGRRAFKDWSFVLAPAEHISRTPLMNDWR